MKNFKKIILFFLLIINFIGCKENVNEEKNKDLISDSTKNENLYKSALSYIDSLDFEKATQIADELNLEQDGVKISKKIDSIIIKNKSLYLKKLNVIQESYLKKIYSDYDEFKKITWYKPKSEKNDFKNTIYCYFGKEDNGSVMEPRIYIRYYGDDWIFWQKVDFLIDGISTIYVPSESPTHTNSNTVWEIADEKIDSSLTLIINSMYEAKTVKYRLEGRDYVKDFNLSKNKILQIKNILELNKIMTSIYILNNMN